MAKAPSARHTDAVLLPNQGTKPDKLNSACATQPSPVAILILTMMPLKILPGENKMANGKIR